MSNAFWDAHHDATTTQPGTPEHDDAMARAEQALADAEAEQEDDR